MCSLGNTNPTFSSQIEPAVPYGRTNISYKDYRFKIRFFRSAKKDTVECFPFQSPATRLLSEGNREMGI